MKWSPYVKRFLIVTAIVAVIIALACIFFWEWDGLLYFIWGVWGLVAFYRIYVLRKLDGRKKSEASVSRRMPFHFGVVKANYLLSR